MALKQRAAHSILKLGSITGIKYVVSFGSQIAFARLLTPSIFGIVTLSSAILTIISILGQWGISEALMQDTEHGDVFSTVFWLRMAYVAFFLLSTVGFALVARPYYQSIAIDVLIVLTLGKVFKFTATPFKGVLQREFKLPYLGFISLCSLVVGVVVGLWMVLSGYDIWGLVAYYLLRDVVESAGIIVSSPKYPQLKFDPETAWWFGGFARNLFLSNGINVLRSRTDDYFIGTIVGTSALGAYTIALRLGGMLTTIFQSSVNQTIMPTFSRLEGEERRTVRGLVLLLRFQAYGSVPVSILLSLKAPDVIFFFYGQKWADAAPVLQILAIGGILFPLVSSIQKYLYSVGDGATVLRIQLRYVSAFVVALLFVVGSYGAIGAAVVLVSSQALALFLLSRTLRSKLSFDARSAFAAPTVSGLVTAVVVHLTHVTYRAPTFVPTFVPNSERLSSILTFGVLTATVFYLTLVVISYRTVREDAEIVKQALTG